MRLFLTQFWQWSLCDSDQNDENGDEQHSDDAAAAAWDDDNGVDEDKLMTWNSVTHTLPPQLKPFFYAPLMMLMHEDNGDDESRRICF